jgi:hypothetical protein
VCTSQSARRCKRQSLLGASGDISGPRAVAQRGRLRSLLSRSIKLASGGEGQKMREPQTPRAVGDHFAGGLGEMGTWPPVCLDLPQVSFLCNFPNNRVAFRYEGHIEGPTKPRAGPNSPFLPLTVTYLKEYWEHCAPMRGLGARDAR